MPVYEYKGVSYELADGLSNEQALTKIKTHLGEVPKEAASPQEKKDFAYNTTNPLLKGLLDIPVGVGQLFMQGAEGVTSGFGLAPNKVSESIGKERVSMEERIKQAEEKFKEANPDFSWGRLGGNIAGSVITAPATAVTKAPMLVRAAIQGGTSAAMQPVLTDDYWAAKGGQVAVGAVLGPLTEGGVKAIGALGGLVKGLTPKGREETLRKYLNELAGPEKDKVVAALQDAAELVTGSRPTAAEALVSIPSSVELIAAQAKLANKPGIAGKFATRSAEQQDARVQALDKIAGTPAQKAAVEAKRNAVTGPLRETALDTADTARTALSDIDDKVMGTASRIIKQNEDMSGLPYPKGNLDVQGQSRAITETAQDTATQLKQHQLKSLEEVGVFPLLSKDIISKIDSAIKGTDSDLSKQLLGAFKEKLQSKTDANGFIKSSDLYQNVRKVTNADIAKLLNLGDNYASGGIPQEAAKTAGNVKKFIDASLNKSSNGVWSKYINNYKAYSDKLNRMEVGEYLSKRLETPLDAERAGVFATAVENAAGTIKKATGIPRFDKLSQVLTPKENASVNAVLADLNRKVKAKELASKVGKADEGLPNPANEVPNLLSRGIAISKAVIEHLQRGNQKEFNAKMSELMLEPKALATFMTTTVPKGRINEFTTALMKNMDEPTKAAFIQAFTVPAASGMVGGTIE